MKTKTKHEFKKVVFTIDIDYLELVEALDLDHIKKGSDIKIITFLDSQEFKSFYDPDPYNFCFNTLNPELAESCSGVTINNPTKKDYENYYLD